MKVHHVKTTLVSGGMGFSRTYLTITPNGKNHDAHPAIVFAPALMAITEIRVSEFGSGLIDIQFLDEALAMVRSWVESGREDFSEFEPPAGPDQPRVHGGSEVTRGD